MFFEAGVKGPSSFADVEFGAFGPMNNVHDVVRLARDDALLGLRVLDVI